LQEAQLEKRLNIAKNIKEFKKHITNNQRKQEILDKIKSKYIQNIYKTIFKNSKKIQRF